MIQRVQTIFLFLAAAAAFGLFALPFATTSTAVQASGLFADSSFNLNDHIALLILFCLAGGLALVSIFLFNNRKIQMTLGRLAIVANIIGFVLAIILFMQDRDNLGAATPDDAMGSLLPLAFLIFGVLALRYINKDEKTVRSMDRLR